MKRLVLGALAFSLLGSVAQAQTTVIKGEDRVVHKKSTTLDFTDVRIDGDYEKPVGVLFNSRPKVKFDSLIRLRANFNPELSDSVSHL